ncbi:ras association domain-containing protein 2 isoform X2 [Patella vulgata]|nr:ras association domain-containing protein 2 isoform X2 [Patella vulgata]
MVLYGPKLVGYGSNISSPANFQRNRNGVTISDDLDMLKTEIFSFPSTKENGTTVHSKVASSKLQRHSSPIHSPPEREDSIPTREIFDFATIRTKRSLSHHEASSSKDEEKPEKKPVTDAYVQEMQDKVEEYNRYYKGKVRHQVTTELKEGELVINGPLRIYWGVGNPIRLKQCDDLPATPVASWRHSLYYPKDSVKIDKPIRLLSPTPQSPPPKSPTPSTMDDNFLSSTSDVVVRRIRKFNTVAYRGDRPNKWKRASINGHIYNYDTSVFTPVLGSCTSVMVSNNMRTPDVVRTLLEKFKVENQPDEYVLTVVLDTGEEKLLKDTDYPLLHRLNFGPDENQAKIFIKEVGHVPKGTVVDMPIIETEESENLPEEVEQLLILPEAALKGILVKFEKDEEKDIYRIKQKYSKAKDIMLRRISRQKTA